MRREHSSRRSGEAALTCRRVESLFDLLAAAGAQPARTPVHVDPFWVEVLLSGWAQGFALVWGALWGSFANVVIYRLPRGMSVVRPRSRCGSCETALGVVDNIPIVSYLVLRGRCRHCKATYSSRYVVVEALAATLAFALYVRIVQVPLVAGHGVNLLGWLAAFGFSLALLIVAYIDLDLWIIPDGVVLPMAVVGVGLAVLSPESMGVGWVEALAAGGLAAATFWLIYIFYKRVRGIEGLGLGDAKLLLMVGVFTGFTGVAWTVGAGALQGLLISVPLLIMGRTVANSDLQAVHGADPELGQEDPDAGISGTRVPFGPFLALAALEYTLLKAQILAMFSWLAGGGAW